jgi:hypothetical protein
VIPIKNVVLGFFILPKIFLVLKKVTPFFFCKILNLSLSHFYSAGTGQIEEKNLTV